MRKASSALLAPLRTQINERYAVTMESFRQVARADQFHPENERDLMFEQTLNIIFEHEVPNFRISHIRVDATSAFSAQLASSQNNCRSRLRQYPEL